MSRRISFTLSADEVLAVEEAMHHSQQAEVRQRATAIRLLEEYKPGRRLQTNVEFYTALLLHGLGLEVTLFTPTFAISRVSGWIAHAMEQQRAGRIIRPASEYIGRRDRTWVPVPARGEKVQVS